MAYMPRPIDTSKILLDEPIRQLTESLARHTHDVWAEQRLKDGWTWGARRNDARKEHPCLIDYDELPESEKQHDRNTAMETLRAIVALGFEITSRRSNTDAQ
ncbi:MAG: Ryanodine receptor Ryr [Planctomycetes bacterium]|nr:Ryanodine receptor Ryr [Planctomycetota bacterium]